ncbi:MAG TPA: Crp/Fnr family transcriptional regulator [Actinomycetota bacterium]|nr:Crp/Fnr family transcriptional regulator [Actinomycetota bacterium]
MTQALLYQSAPTGNDLLDRLPSWEQRDLLLVAEQVALAPRQVIFEPCQLIDRAWFPLAGVISLVARTSDGAGVAVASVGREGMVGLPIVLGEASSPNLTAAVQVPGTALTVGALELRRRSRPPAGLHMLLQAYAHTLLTRTAQEAACNRRHTVLQRCACLLLQTEDRVGAPDFPLTQDQIAHLLGTRRASVVGAARTLQEAGAIRYRRGRLHVADRRTLARLSCDCYEVIAISPRIP